MKPVTKNNFIAQSETYFVRNRYRGEKSVVCKKANETTIVGCYQNYYDYDCDCLYFELVIGEYGLVDSKFYDSNSEDVKQHPLYEAMLQCENHSSTDDSRSQTDVLDLIFEFANDSDMSEYYGYVGDEEFIPFCFEHLSKKHLSAISPELRKSIRSDMKDCTDGDRIDHSMIQHEVLFHYLSAVLN